MRKEKRYTFVACNEFFDFKPEVRTGQELKEDNPVSYWIDENNNPPLHAGFNVNDSYGVWGLSTSQKENKYDNEFNAPYVVFDYNQIKITLRAPAGHKIYWTVALEND